eukprot:TRINITY_DN510_c5_g1_i1.p1 TRINITY_DN510_c5_g1~~TRINITY_DN510_c5_g1_i1.p1  ORF type:complete len:279 (+),score=40.86 TRINITY_DN510_c5_g1_i1:56-838(+)
MKRAIVSGLQSARMTKVPIRLVRTQAIVCDDTMARYPDSTPEGVLRCMDYIGSGLFACSGCVTAGVAGMDLFGCTVVGSITALGGGTVRDIILGQTPVSWVEETEYLYIAVVCAAGTFLLWTIAGEEVERRIKSDSTVFWLDSMGLGAFAVIGVQNALRSGLGVLPSVMCGVVTATFGGLVRDSLCRKPARILHAHDETYALAPLLASMSYLSARHLGFALPYRILVGVSAALMCRYVAVTHQFRLPEAPVASCPKMVEI